MDDRLKLIEVASTRPHDIKGYYDKYLIYVSGCSMLSTDAPPTLQVMYRKKLVSFDPKRVPFLLAGKNPDAPRTCGVANCINPAHVL